MGESPAEGRAVASILPFSILRFLSRALGAPEAERVRVAAGETKTMEELMERGAWSSLASTLAIADAATRLTGDAQIGRRGGEELFRLLEEVGMTDMTRARGSVEAALEAVIAGSSRVSVGKVMSIVDQLSDSLLVEGHYTRGTKPETLFCDYSTGYWSLIPSLFGAAGYAVELECEARGDERCLTRISWVEPHTTSADIESATARSNETFVRYEELQQMAADLIAAEDVSTVLDLVVQRAGHAVLAPRFLLAVRLPDEDGLRVHHLGFRDDDSARRAADAIVDGRQSPSTLVVDVASARHRYGSIAALYPRGTTGSDVDQRLMSAYAAHAAAALEATAAFERAQRDRDTAQALLDLSRRIAGAGSVSEVAARLANALPAVAGSYRGSIYLWDPVSGSLLFAACDDATDATTLPSQLAVDQIEGAGELLATGGPILLDADLLAGDLLALLESSRTQLNASVPIVARGEFLGVVSASFDRRVGEEERGVLIQRLLGFADQAATAFDNARLLEHTKHQAAHDELTGLANRSTLEGRVDHALARARRGEGLVGLLFVDLDRFKYVNDTLGHGVGDDLITLVATRLQRELREVDLLARVGGDEFVVLLEDVSDELAAVAMAERLVSCLDEPFDVAGHELYVSCSIGVAVSQGSIEYEALLQQADAAMYQAKDSGRNTCAIHVAARGREASRRLELANALHSALAHGELRVVYQPQVDLATGAIVGAEALARWDHPIHGAIGPEVFIPIAEDSGLILEIDRWVRRTGLVQMQRWRHAELPAIRVAFNLSTRELRNPGLPAQLARDIADAGIDAGMVELEITERVVMADNDELVLILQALRSIGVRLAIDDFGTGSAVLGRLQRHPVDTLKIDRSFIAELSSPASGAVVAALVQMGASLGIEVLAEGVETEVERATLSSLGCTLAQGHLFSMPVSGNQLAELLLAETAHPAARRLASNVASGGR